MYLWTDVETTGLDTKNDVILEVAAIVTDENLIETARFHAVTCGARMRTYHSLHKAVQDMHAANGLWMESLRATMPLTFGLKETHLDRLFTAFVLEHAVKAVDDPKSPSHGKTIKPVLAGSSVHFDRQCLDTWCPEAVKQLHYRILDVSSLNELVMHAWPEIWTKRPGQDNAVHRAMPDIETSLAVARYYREALGPKAGTFASHAPEPGAL